MCVMLVRLYVDVCVTGVDEVKMVVRRSMQLPSQALLIYCVCWSTIAVTCACMTMQETLHVTGQPVDRHHDVALKYWIILTRPNWQLSTTPPEISWSSACTTSMTVILVLSTCTVNNLHMIDECIISQKCSFSGWIQLWYDIIISCYQFSIHVQ